MSDYNKAILILEILDDEVADEIKKHIEQLESENAELKANNKALESAVDTQDNIIKSYKLELSELKSRSCERCKYENNCGKEVYTAGYSVIKKITHCSLYEESEK